MITLIVALASLQEKSEAEQVFRAMEDKFVKARTLQFRSKMKTEGGTRVEEAEATCVLADGNKLNFSLKTAKGTRQLLSDGKTFRTSRESDMSDDKDTPKALGECLRLMFAWYGAVGARLAGDLEDAGALRKSATLSDFALGAREKIGDREAHVLTFSAKLEQSTTVTVWIDTQTSLTLKRVLKDDALDSKLIETVEKLVLDEKVDEAQFKVTGK